MRELNHVELNSVNGAWGVPSVSGLVNYLPGFITSHPYATAAVAAVAVGAAVATYFGYVDLSAIKSSPQE